MAFYTIVVERRKEIVKEKRDTHREGRCISKMHIVKKNQTVGHTGTIPFLFKKMLNYSLK